jgi:hypothetical protein
MYNKKQINMTAMFSQVTQTIYMLNKTFINSAITLCRHTAIPITRMIKKGISGPGKSIKEG